MYLYTLCCIRSEKFANATTSKWAPSFSTNSSGSGTVATSFRETRNLDFDNFNGSTSSRDLTVTITGARVGDSCSCAPSTSFTTGILWQCSVTTDDTVVVRLSYVGGGSYNPPATDFNIVVTEF